MTTSIMAAVPADLAPVPVHRSSDLEIWVLPCGWISTHPPQVEFRGPSVLGLPAILTSRAWVPWMPINTVLVRHRSGTVLVDTGDAEDRPAGHYACGSDGNGTGDEWFYRTHLRIEVPAGTSLGPRLRQIGVDPAEVDDVVVTHLHGDHVGGFGVLSPRRVVVGRGAATVRGALGCRLDGLPVEEPAFVPEASGPFGRSWPLDPDGRVRVVPLPGHTPGHLGLAIDTGNGHVVAAGDAAFSQEQIARRGTPGIAHDARANRRTQASLAEVTAAGGRVLLSHEVTPARFAVA